MRSFFGRTLTGMLSIWDLELPRVAVKGTRCVAETAEFEASCASRRKKNITPRQLVSLFDLGMARPALRERGLSGRQ